MPCSHIFGSQPVRCSALFFLFVWIRPDIRLSASQAKDGHGSTPLHKAAGTVNATGAAELLALRACPNAINDRGQAPFDMVSACNASLKSTIRAWGGSGVVFPRMFHGVSRFEGSRLFGIPF